MHGQPCEWCSLHDYVRHRSTVQRSVELSLECTTAKERLAQDLTAWESNQGRFSMCEISRLDEGGFPYTRHKWCIRGVYCYKSKIMTLSRLSCLPGAVVKVGVPRGPGAVEGKGELLVVLVLLTPHPESREHLLQKQNKGQSICAKNRTDRAEHSLSRFAPPMRAVQQVDCQLRAGPGAMTGRRRHRHCPLQRSRPAPAGSRRALPSAR
jgi:hypothetical protein